ncbi:MAG: hypothetical protein F7C34_01185 [Desulfurococcales archaeon]|nr:hypothetical protein [Desulfurococcales archaeon]
MSRAGCRAYVVKLGGSLITVKSMPRTIDEKTLVKAADIVAYARVRGASIAVVHGGGSFGHHEVGAILRAKRRLEPADAARIQKAMIDLSIVVVEKLLERGVPASMHPPHTYCYQGTCNYEALKRDLTLGLVPVTYGDALPTRDGVTIVSGDKLASDLSLEIGPGSCLVYAMREEHVLSPEGRPLRVVRSLQDFSVVGGGSQSDFTGGIKAKVAEAMRAAAGGVRVVITGIEGLEKILVRGEDPENVGTLIVPKREG